MYVIELDANAAYSETFKFNEWLCAHAGDSLQPYNDRWTANPVPARRTRKDGRIHKPHRTHMSLANTLHRKNAHIVHELHDTVRQQLALQVIRRL